MDHNSRSPLEDITNTAKKGNIQCQILHGMAYTMCMLD